MTTASYISDEMKTLHDEAVNKKIALLNEVGLDPGLDHMSALRLINGARNQG